MLLRIRSKDGNFRFELAPTAYASELEAKILETTQGADPASLTISNQPRGNETKLAVLRERSLQSLGLKHGDLLFVSYSTKAEAPAMEEPPVSAPTSSSNALPANRPWESVQEDVVDQYWRKQDGKIKRNRDNKFCKHGPNAMCDYCMPLEPYDPRYHSDHSIKHLSFHAYLRKLAPSSASAAVSSTSSIPPLNPLSYRVKVPCSNQSHPPWPAGICTACQPSAITLQPQPFRMVDHVEFSTPAVIDTFLQSWRTTGHQRFGWLLGKYMPYEEVPMGIKAVVEAIHEPPQDGDLDGLSLELPWGDEERIVSLARQAGLSAVGIIFTDLTPEPNDKSKSVCKRHANSFFLSSLETLFAAQLQLDHPTSTRSSPTGKFSSRLVTAVLSGTPDGKIDVAAYQVSEQGCAMLDADMIEPSVEPGTVRVKEETEGRYIPDVFFRFKNEFGIEVKQSAKPCFPVEYLIVNVTHGFPTNPSSIFLSHNFPVENRPFTHPQDTNAIFSTLSRLRASEIRSSRRGSDPEMAEKRRNLLKWLSDWHLLAFLPSTGMLSEEDMEVVMKAAVSPSLDDPKALDALLSSDGWQTLLTIAQETAPLPRAQTSGGASRPDIIPPLQEPVSSSRSGPQPMDDDFIPPEILEESLRANPPGGTAGGSATRICPHCTFENPPGGPDCEVCGLPLSG